MPLEYIYICRHGFRSNWVDPSIKTGPTGMSRDPPLAAYGLTQSAQLAGFLSSPEALAPHPVPEKVFSSPFYRCIQTSVPTSLALQAKGAVKGGEGVKLEHGVMEWYSPARPGTGLHPRPSSPKTLSPLFPDQLDLSYDSTHFPSRKGELIRDLQDRADTFIEAWTGRVEEMGVRSVVVFGHAASVIALGRALTGNKYLDVSAGCASCSLYKRKTPSTTSTPASASGTEQAGSRPSITETRSTASLGAASGLLQLSGSEKDLPPCGVGEWEPVWLGRADYLDNGVERDWSMRDCVIIDGEVVSGDHQPHPPEDAIPVGLAPGMERYLRRGLPAKTTGIKEIDEAVAADKLKEAAPGNSKM